MSDENMKGTSSETPSHHKSNTLSNYSSSSMYQTYTHTHTLTHTYAINPIYRYVKY